MEYVVPIIVGLFALAGSIGSAFIVHSKNKTTIELKLDYQTQVLDNRIGHLGETIDLKLKNLDKKIDDVSTEVKCVDTKVDKVKTKVIELEKDVETLKGGGMKLANT